jgi:hypothetical protein
MANKAGVGFSEKTDSFEAGVEAAQAAVNDGGISRCDLVMLFSTSRHQPNRLRDGVRSVVGTEARLIGGYGTGIITTRRFGYDGCQVGVAVFSLDSMKVDMFIEDGLPGNEYNVGQALGRQIISRAYQGEPNLDAFSADCFLPTVHAKSSCPQMPRGSARNTIPCLRSRKAKQARRSGRAKKCSSAFPWTAWCVGFSTGRIGSSAEPEWQLR